MIKPEFWEDEKVGLLSFGARLLFIGMWNLANDKGILRYNSAYLKSSVFIYDNISIDEINKFMEELTKQKFVIEYKAGETNQTYAIIVNFLKHQKIDKPQPSKLPEPSSDLLNSTTNSTNDSENGSSNTSETDSENRYRPKEEKRKEEKGKEILNSQIAEVFNYFNTTLNKRLKLDSPREAIIRTRLMEGIEVEDLKHAILNFSKDDWVDRKKYVDIVYAIGRRSKVDNFEKWFNFAPKGEVSSECGKSKMDSLMDMSNLYQGGENSTSEKTNA
jgi:uncharacterized phage protein (TIGR02220 family)